MWGLGEGLGAGMLALPASEQARALSGAQLKVQAISPQEPSLSCPPSSKVRGSPYGLPSTWFLTRSQFQWLPVREKHRKGQNGKVSGKRAKTQ